MGLQDVAADDNTMLRKVALRVFKGSEFLVLVTNETSDLLLAIFPVKSKDEQDQTLHKAKSCRRRTHHVV